MQMQGCMVFGILCAFVCSAAAAFVPAPFNLTIEYLDGSPRGIDSPAPRFGYLLSHPDRAQSQTAYQIQVATFHDQVTIWDSGKVVSPQTSQIPYDAAAGGALQSDTDYQWRVQWWDAQGTNSDFSEWQQFSTGLFNASDWTGQWLTGGGVGNQFRLSANVFQVARASAFITGLGYYEFYINGQKVDDYKLDPGWTTYQKRVLYSSYDVTDYFNSDVNCLAVILGRGWYVMEGYGNSTFRLQINLQGVNGETATIVSDSSWEVSAGPITYDDVYNGEHFDARQEIATGDFCSSSTTSWVPVAVQPEGPGGVVVSQTFPPIRVIQEIPAVAVTNPKSGYYVVDFGQSLSGWCQLAVKAPTTAGTQITLAHAEVLMPDGSGMIYTAELRGAQATDIYTTKGSSSDEIWEPRFTYHGFRYVQITGLPYAPDLSTLTAKFVRSSVENHGSISFSIPILNQIQHNIVWGQGTNLMSVPTDCDNRDERKGWMGDAALSADEAFHNYYMPAFYSNWMNMIQDEQTLDQNGALTDTTPLTFGSRQSDPSWGTAYPTILHGMWKYFGDTRIIQNHFDSVKAYINWLVSLAEQDFRHFYVEYGDWVPPPESPKVDGSLTSAFAFLHDLRYYADMAGAIGETAEQHRAEQLFANYSAAFNSAFLNQTSGLYLDGLQTGQSLPLWLDIVPSNMKESLVNYMVQDIVVTHNVHLTTGIIGTKYLSLSLSDNGQSNIALALATQTTYPSWGYMITNTIEPATTLWELWNTPTGDPGMDSRDHIMFGSVGHWFYTVLAGLDQTDASSGYEVFQIMPRPSVSSLFRKFAQPKSNGPNVTQFGNQNIVEGAPLLDWVSASVLTCRGRAEVSWLSDSDKQSFSLNVTIPVTSTAVIYVPVPPTVTPSAVSITEGTSTVWKAMQYVPGVAGILSAQFVKTSSTGDGPFVQFQTGSGDFQFQLTVSGMLTAEQPTSASIM